MSRRFAMLVSFLFVTITVLVSQPKLLWTTTKTNPDSTIQLSDAARDYSGNIYTVTFGGIKYGITLNKYSNVGTLIRETPLSNQITFKYWLAADKGGNAYVVTNDDQKKLTLTKYSPTGDSLWAKKLILSIPQEDYREGNTLIDIDGDGNVCIATSHEQLNGEGNFQAYLMMLSYSPNGDRRWMDTTISGLSAAPAEFGDIGIGQMKIDPFNNIYVSVSYKSRFDTTAYIAGSKLLKYAPATGGVMNPPQWITNFSLKTISVEAAAMDIDKAGNIFMGYSHFISFDVGGRVRKYNSQGALQWERMINSSGAKIAADNNGGVYVGAGKTISASSVIARVFRFNGAESTYVGNFGSGNYSSIYNLSVDQGGYLAVSGIAKPQVFSTEGSYYFFEFTPSGAWNGYAMYASPGVSQEYPSHLFKGNGSYIALGVSGYAQSKAVVWISKIQVAPETPLDPGGNGGGSEPQLSPVLIPSGTTADLHGVWFNTPLDGFIVGDNSTILRTTNGGSSWTKQVSPVIANFRKVRFVDSDTGFIIGQGYTLKTADKGNTWNAVDNYGNQTLYGFDWNDSGVVIAVGSEGTIRRSSDWGSTWQNLSLSNTNAALRDVAYGINYHDKVKFVAGGDLGLIIESNSKGLEWNEIQGTSILSGNIRSVIIDDGSSYFIGDVVYKYYNMEGFISTEDILPKSLIAVNKSLFNERYNYRTLINCVGENGSIISIDTEDKKFSISGQSRIDGQTFLDIYQDGAFCIVVGLNGSIFKLIDGFTIAFPYDEWEDRLSIHSLAGAIYSGRQKTTDAGRTWSKLQELFLPTLQPIKVGSIFRYPNTNTVFGISVAYSDTLVYSTDLGDTWSIITLPDTSIKIFLSVQRGSANTAWVTAQLKNDEWVLYRTSDFGKTWVFLKKSISRIAINVRPVDSLIVWGSGFDENLSSIFFSDNGGDSWLQAGTKGSVYPISRDIAIKYSDGIYERTGNRGESWDKIVTPDNIFNRIAHSSDLFVVEYIKGGPVFSTDGGLTWQKDISYFFSRSLQDYRVRIGDSTYLVTKGKNSVYLSSIKKVSNSSFITPPIFFRDKLKKMIQGSASNSDTINVPAYVVGSSVKKITVRLDSLLAPSTEMITITLAHNGIIDTLFFKHEGNNIFYCSFSDGSPGILYDRAAANFAGHFKPYSPLQKFNDLNPSGNWILTIYNEAATTAELRGWSLIIESDNVTNVKQNGIIPTEFALSQNYPNPFNPTTTINYQIPTNSKVSLQIYDILGREVATLVNEVVNAGTYSTPFNSTRLASGVYFYRIEATSTDGSRNRFVDVKKMMYLK